MATLLAKNAEILVTMDGRRRELMNAGVYVEDGFIKPVGRNEELPATADTVLDLSGQIALPGLVNAHHHVNQTLTRNLVADFFSLDLHTIGYAGALHDPVAATLFCAPQGAKFTVVNAMVIVRDGDVVTMEMKTVIETHNRCASEMANA
jgi:adenine deaminase